MPRWILPFIFKQHETENTDLQQLVAKEQPARLCRNVSVSDLLCDLLACCFSGAFSYELAVTAVSISYHF